MEKQFNFIAGQIIGMSPKALELFASMNPAYQNLSQQIKAMTARQSTLAKRQAQVRQMQIDDLAKTAKR